MRDVTEAAPLASGDKSAGAMTKFIQNLAKHNKAQHDQLVELMHYFNRIDVDLRLVSQLKAIFISKE